MRLKYYFWFVIATLLGGLLAAILFYVNSGYYKEKIMEEMHVLKHPMIIGTEKNNGYYMVPKGTTLYFDAAMPEGFFRYRMYVNVFSTRLKHEANVPAGSINPESIFPIDKAQLLSMFNTIRLDKDDLKLILDNGQFSPADKREIIEYLETNR